MFKEIFRPSLKTKEVPTEKEIKNETEKSLAEYYQTELLPLIKIFESSIESRLEQDGMLPISVENYENKTLRELREAVENNQNLQNRMTVGPEETQQEMKKLLMNKFHFIIQDLENKKNKKPLITEEKDVLKKAKIALISANDYSDLEKNYQKYQIDPEKSKNGRHIMNYFDCEKSRWQNNGDEDLRLTANEISALINGGQEFILLDIENYKYANLIEETPNELLQLLIQKNDYSIVEKALTYCPLSGGYSKETTELLIKTDFNYLIFKNISLFEKSLTPDSFKELIESYGPDYPYKINDILEPINKLNWDKSLKTEIIDFTFKHQIVCDKGYKEILGEGDSVKYDQIENDIKKIICSDQDWNRYLPEDLPEEEMLKLKGFIQNGYATFFQGYPDHFQYFIKNNYDWLRDQMINNDQENLLLSRGGLKKEDQVIYLEKLANQGKTSIIKKLIEKGSLCQDILSPENYDKILDNNYVVPIEFLSGNLSENSFSEIIKKNPDYLKGQKLYENIDRFDFDNNTNFEDYKNYQTFIVSIEEKFGLKNDRNLNNGLYLEKLGTKKEELLAFQEELLKKADILKSKLDLLYPSIEKTKQMNSFGAEFGFYIFNKNEVELDIYLDTIAFLPTEIRQSNKNIFLKLVAIVVDSDSEKKEEIKKNLDKMAEIFDISRHPNIYENYFNLLNGQGLSKQFQYSRSIAEIIPEYSLFYKKLNSEEKIFFQQIFPWSESLLELKNDPEDIKLQNKYLVPLLQSDENKIVNFNEKADGALVVEYLEKFSLNKLPELLSLFVSIRRNLNVADLSPKIIKTLKDDFKIDTTKHESIDSVINQLQSVYQAIFINNRDLVNSKFESSRKDNYENENLYDYIKLLALNNQINKEDNDLIINFFEKYVSNKTDKYGAKKNLKDSGVLFRNLNNNGSENWAANLTAYVEIIEEIFTHAPEDLKNTILNKFSGDYRDECLDNMRQEWLGFLNNQDNSLPLRLGVIAKTIENAGGAGNLKYIEALSDVLSQVDKSFANPKTTERTKKETKKVLGQIEEKFDKDKWPQDDRAKFYNLSSDIIAAAPSLFNGFAPIFDQISGKEVKLLLKDLMPLYQVELIITQRNDKQNYDDVSYNPKDLVPIRQALINFAANLKLFPEDKNSIFEDEKNRLIEVMQTGFKKRFGLIKVPVEFKKAELKNIQNCVRFAGNISQRDTKKETLIAFYLGLELNGEWENFRQGQKINPEEYLTPEKASIIKTILENKNNNNLPLEIAGIKDDELENFQKILQGEVSSSLIGNIETVDIKLGNIKRSVEELIDPDIYENEADKNLIKLLLDNGKSVGTVLAKTYSEINNKNVNLNDSEKELQKKIASIFGVSAWTSDLVKQIQDKIQPFSLITGLISKLNEEKVDENISKLQKNLEPSENIIAIFNRLSVDFKPSSGALAINQDLEVLEELIIKNESKLSKNEKEVVDNYLNVIKEDLVKLELTFQKTKEYFNKVKKSLHTSQSELLKDRFTEVEKIINAKGSETMVNSKLTKDLNLIIENMRQCLGCLRKEVNNDTNLAFGDFNKFFLISQKEKESGSIADEIVFFVPIKIDSRPPEMSFIMDKVYGSKSPDILIAHVLSVYKKYEALKGAFKNSNLSISVPDAALSSVGLNQELFQKIIKEKIIDLKSSEYIDGMIANIPESSLSDNYVEFSNKGAREKGERIFSGVVIK